MQRRQFHAGVQTDNAHSMAHVSDPQADNTMLMDDTDTTFVEEDVDTLGLGEMERKGKMKPSK